MAAKTLILSSSGLKNIVENKNIEWGEFTFIFGEEKITMNSIFAEFLSPKVSRLHQSDPTIEFINYNNIKNTPKTVNSQTLNNLFTKENLKQLIQLSHGHSIEVKEEEIHNLQIISILLDNTELFTKLSELYTTKSEENANDVDYLINQLQMYENFRETTNFDFSLITDQIASQFYNIDKNKLKVLPLSIIYSIITSDKLKLENEDSLLDFINDLFSDENDRSVSDMTIYSFYETVDIKTLSGEKFKQLLENFDYQEMTSNLWSSLVQCFYVFHDEVKIDENRYSNGKADFLNKSSEIKYDGDGLNGIIRRLTEKCGGNVDDKNCVKITSSSILRGGYEAKNAADLSQSNFFHSACEQFSWLKYDFNEMKIRPTHYSIKNSYDVNSSPKSWVFEGSNTGRDGDWDALDSQTNNSIFQPCKPVLHTFDIKQPNDFYRFLRIRSTGSNNSGYNYLAIESLEFFGFVQPKI